VEGSVSTSISKIKPVEISSTISLLHVNLATRLEATLRNLEWGGHVATSEIRDTSYSACGSAITIMAL